jgi:putative acetyltransferase
MIERLTTNLDALAWVSPAELRTDRGTRITADCADAIRLELDCQQQELVAGERQLLSALGDALEASFRDEAVVRMASAACWALGICAAIELWRATHADCAVAQDIVHERLSEHRLGILLDTSDKNLRDLEGHYDARGGAFELIFVAGRDEPIGVLGWHRGTDGVVELKKVYLRRRLCGLGVGGIAVQWMIDRARTMGASAIVCETVHAMRDAIRLYTRLGFRPVTGADAAASAKLGDDCEQAFRLDLTLPAP